MIAPEEEIPSRALNVYYFVAVIFCFIASICTSICLISITVSSVLLFIISSSQLYILYSLVSSSSGVSHRFRGDHRLTGTVVDVESMGRLSVGNSPFRNRSPTELIATNPDVNVEGQVPSTYLVDPYLQ